jgi:hypothetical protein
MFASLVNIEHSVFWITSTYSLAPFFMDVFLYSIITFFNKSSQYCKGIGIDSCKQFPIEFQTN